MRPRHRPIIIRHVVTPVGFMWRVSIRSYRHPGVTDYEHDSCDYAGALRWANSQLEQYRYQEPTG